MEKSTIEFHPQASARFNELGQEILQCVGSFGAVSLPPATASHVHPVAAIPESDIIGEIKVRRSSINRLGEETGRYWDSKGLLVGWEGRDFERIRELVRRLATASPIKGLVSEPFLLDEVFTWLRETLERQRSDSLSDYVAKRCSDEIEEHEIWIPIHQSYSAQEFALGDVEVRTISKEMMDDWFDRFLRHEPDPIAAHAFNKRRSQMQGGIAAQIKVKAEREKAREIAHVAANEAVGLLRFLSHVNWTSKIVSYCAPLGRENTLQSVELFVTGGVVVESQRASIDQGPAGWNIDEARALCPTVLDDLQKLAADRDGTGFRRDLYDALQLHSRNTLAAAVSHKIVFVISAIESLLLKDSSEPIQKNLGERMAFLIGKSLEARKKIVANVEDFYRIRSRMIHHGREASPTDIEVIDHFFFNVWWTFRHLLASLDRFKTKEEMLSALEDEKLSS